MRKPARMSEGVVRRAACRIREHAEIHGLSSVDIIFHGGEPLLVRVPGLLRFKEIIEEGLGGVAARFGMQTNGVLITPSGAEALRDASISVGISLDGPADVHDRHRPDLRGHDSHARVLSGARAAREAGILSGFLAVIDVESDPAAILQFFDDLGARQLDLLLPHGHHDKLPPHKE